MRGGDEAEGGGDGGGGAVAGFAVEAQVAAFGAFVRDGAVALGENGGLAGENGGHAEFLDFFSGRGFGEAVVGAEVFAGLQEQGVLAGEGEVGDLDAARVAATAGRPAGDDGNAAFFAGGDQMALLTHGVDGIDDDVKSCTEELVGILFGIKRLFFFDGAVGIDGVDAVGHGGGFEASDLAVHGMELSVHIAEANFIEIDQSQVAHSRAGECFDCPRTHAANADNGYARLRKPL